MYIFISQSSTQSVPLVASTNDCVSIPKKEAKLKPSSSQAYVDNPCCGGPELQQHNLSYLLELISSGKFNIDASNREETIILHNDNDFLVIDKVSVTRNFSQIF